MKAGFPYYRYAWLALCGLMVSANANAMDYYQQQAMDHHKAKGGQFAKNGERIIVKTDPVTGKVTVHQIPHPAPSPLYPPIDWQTRPLSSGRSR